MANSTVPMFDPTGQVRLIPADQAQAASAAGGKPAVKMMDPSGTLRWIPQDQQDAALKAGGKLAAPPSTSQGFLGSFSDASGLSSLGNAIAHPIDTVMGIPAAVKGVVSNTVDNVKQGVADYQKTGLSDTTRRDFGRAIPIVGPALATAQAQQDAGNTSGMLGTVAGTVASLAAPAALKGAGEALPAVGRSVGGAMEDVGQGLQNRAVKSINRTIGGTQADFSHNTNIGRGYIDANLGVSGSMEKVATKAASAQESVGVKLGDLYQKATDSGHLISVSKVEDALTAPLGKAYDLENGIGGTGNTAALDNYSSAVKSSIENARAKGGFTPSELFDIKDRIQKQTNWGDAAQKSLNGVRQQQVGAISGVLGDELPDTRQLNQAYGDLGTLADRAQNRANTGSRPLTDMAGRGVANAIGAGIGSSGGPAGAVIGSQLGGIVTSMPVRTAAATGMNRLGQGLVSAGGKLGAAADAGGAVGVGVGVVDPITGEPSNNIVQQNVAAIKSDGNNQQVIQGTPLKGQALWQNLGTAKLTDHLSRDLGSDATTISPSDIKSLAKTPQGKSLLIQASDLKPGSAAMKNIVKQITALTQK